MPMAVPLVGELEISLPPCVVPTAAETALANVGVRLIVAPYEGLVEEAVIDALGAATTFTRVVADFVLSSFEVAVIVRLPAVPGAVQAPVAALMEPELADHEMPLVTLPVAVVVKVVVLSMVRVGAAGAMAFTATVCGMTVTELSV